MLAPQHPPEGGVVTGWSLEEMVSDWFWMSPNTPHPGCRGAARPQDVGLPCPQTLRPVLANLVSWELASLHLSNWTPRKFLAFFFPLKKKLTKELQFKNSYFFFDSWTGGLVHFNTPPVMAPKGAFIRIFFCIQETCPPLQARFDKCADTLPYEPRNNQQRLDSLLYFHGQFFLLIS